MFLKHLFKSVLFLFSLWGYALYAQVPSAYEQVAMVYNVPPKLLYAVAMVESRKRYQTVTRPWPWTLNISGKPYFFANKEETVSRLQQEINQGNRAVAIGLMQIYWRYHHDQFQDPAQALDPVTNLTYGAQYLRKLYQTEQDWYLAVGQYYSGRKTPEGMKKANNYADKVMVQWEKL